MDKTFSHKLNTIKWVGIVTMTIDHIGYFLLPELLLLRIIGRVAFPCFLYSTIEGTKRTHHYGRYILRLVLLGILSMPVTPNTVNVLFLLALFSLSLKFKKYALIFSLLSIFAEYSIYGFLFGWSIYWLKEHNWPQGTGLAVMTQYFVGLSIQIFSLLALPLFIIDKGLELPKLPRYFFYAYYPLHQLVLILIVSSL
ncbi:TraX protein [Alkalibacterium subtropicum]|uniref:TraX protein n=1 Tax=Alkalibacterium subtropicum TaxID=753702 RepID=A0A1I1EIG0_9LACT|nr:TraX protein [Alkalibacterium subtropicum]